MATQQTINRSNTLMIYSAARLSILRTTILLLSLALILSISNPAIANCTSPPVTPLNAYDIQGLTWSQLILKTSVLGMSFKAKVGLTVLTDNDAKTKLIHPGQGQGITPSPHVLLVDFSSSSISRKNIRTQLLFNSDNAAALQRTRHESTKGDERHKIYRFTNEGVFIARRKPKEGEAELAVKHWTNASKSFDRYPDKPPQDRVFSDTTALLYIGSMAAFQKPGDKIEFTAYFDDKLHVVTVEYEATETIKTNFRATRNDQSNQHISGNREALRLAIHAHPLGQPKGESTLQIAGLGGAVKLLVDKKLRIPLELRGNAGFMGKTALKLEKVALRDVTH